MPSGSAQQLGFHFAPKRLPPLREQVIEILYNEPHMRGNVGRVVVEVWYRFYELRTRVDYAGKTGDHSGLKQFLAGELDDSPNYKAVSRMYHRIVQESPELGQRPE